MKKTRLFAIEGVDGSGKATKARMLKTRLHKIGAELLFKTEIHERTFNEVGRPI